MKLSDIKPNPDNPRIIRDEHFSKLKKSIQEFPQMMEKRPIVVDENNMILGGNMRFRALQEIYGKKGEIPDKWVSHAVGWTDEQKREFVIKDNAAYGEWDWSVLSQEWDTEQLADWTVYMPAEIPEHEETETKEAEEDDFDPDKPVETVCNKGDIWKLGNHRLMCGDSTDAASVALLMDGEKADMCFTDPPYGVSIGDKNAMLNRVQPSGRCCENIDNDTKSTEELYKILVKAMTNVRENCKDDASYYVTSPQNGELGLMMMMMMRDAGLTVRHMLIWEKNAPTFSLGRLDYDYQHEPIFYTWTEKHHCYRKGEYRSTIWKYDKPRKCDLHPTMKPIQLVANCMKDTTKEGNLCIDLFGGSGTTLIAAEQLNRKCYMMELDPHYCDVIIARWEKLTGSKAERIE